MTRRECALRLLEMLGAVAVARAAAAAPTMGGATATLEGPVVEGRIELPEVTGAAFLPGGALLLVHPEPNGVYLLPEAAARLRSGRVPRSALQPLAPRLAELVALHDLQDAASDGAGNIFLVGSHARTPRGDSPEERYRLARLSFDARGALVEARETDALLRAIVNDLPFVADSIRRTPARAGLCIEGLAWEPAGSGAGHLRVGLRAPTVTESAPRPHGGQEDAVLLRIQNPGALFDAPEAAAHLGETVKLDLHGQGIRGMAWDPGRKALWLLSGLCVVPNHPVESPWGLWLWEDVPGPQGAPAAVRLPERARLAAPTAVCPIPAAAGSGLLLFEAGRPESRYLLLSA